MKRCRFGTDVLFHIYTLAWSKRIQRGLSKRVALPEVGCLAYDAHLHGAVDARDLAGAILTTRSASRPE